MAKFKTFKKIAALATAIALVVCFAVSASAINVETTTTYASVSDKANINVTVTVTDVAGADYVTYYATKASTPVFVDQAEVDGAGKAEFKFQTALDNFDSEVKIGYTNAPAAEDADITTNTIKLSGNDAVLANLPTAETDATVTVDFACAENETVDAECIAVTSGTATVTAAACNAEKTKVEVSFRDIASDVVFTITPKTTTVVTPTIVPEILDAAALTLTAENLGETEENQGSEGARKATVIGNAGNAEDYGVVVTKSAIDVLEFDSLDALNAKYADCVYDALGKSDAGLFAVQLIDNGTNDETAVLKTGDSYNVAVYVKAEDNKYYLQVGAEITVE